mmetsp:Transcript_127642/g.367310  ORF Transcript_127642/g.367310 Transcript_127642/m.367310 type:complete len:214 (-) Transcript_127642:2-643(-)
MAVMFQRKTQGRKVAFPMFRNLPKLLSLRGPSPAVLAPVVFAFIFFALIFLAFICFACVCFAFTCFAFAFFAFIFLLLIFAFVAFIFLPPFFPRLSRFFMDCLRSFFSVWACILRGRTWTILCGLPSRTMSAEGPGAGWLVRSSTRTKDRGLFSTASAAQAAVSKGNNRASKATGLMTRIRRGEERRMGPPRNEISTLARIVRAEIRWIMWQT